MRNPTFAKVFTNLLNSYYSYDSDFLHWFWLVWTHSGLILDWLLKFQCPPICSQVWKPPGNDLDQKFITELITIMVRDKKKTKWVKFRFQLKIFHFKFWYFEKKGRDGISTEKNPSGQCRCPKAKRSKIAKNRRFRRSPTKRHQNSVGRIKICRRFEKKFQRIQMFLIIFSFRFFFVKNLKFLQFLPLLNIFFLRFGNKKEIFRCRMLKIRTKIWWKHKCWPICDETFESISKAESSSNILE